MTNTLIIGASGGIGQALFQLLDSDASHDVMGTYRSPSKFSNSKASQFLPCDISSQQSIDNLYQNIQSQWHQLDLLINCAGILHTDSFGPEKSLNQTSHKQMVESFTSNAMGHLLVLKKFQRLIKTSEQGVAISVSARIGSIEDNQLGGWYSYRMSKAALNMGIKTLSIEWKRTCPNARLLLIHPGTTDTELSKPFQKNLKAGQLQSPEFTAQCIYQQYLNAINTPSFPMFVDYSGEPIPW